MQKRENLAWRNVKEYKKQTFPCKVYVFLDY
jgi:hypothetical protein